MSLVTMVSDPMLYCTMCAHACTDEGYWKNGQFTFHVTIPPEYNIKVSYTIALGHVTVM